MSPLLKFCFQILTSPLPFSSVAGVRPPLPHHGAIQFLDYTIISGSSHLTSLLAGLYSMVLPPFPLPHPCYSPGLRQGTTREPLWLKAFFCHLSSWTFGDHTTQVNTFTLNSLWQTSHRRLVLEFHCFLLTGFPTPWDDYFLSRTLSSNFCTHSCTPTLKVMHSLHTSLWKYVAWEDRNHQTSTSSSSWHQNHKSGYLDSHFFLSSIWLQQGKPLSSCHLKKKRLTCMVQ